MINSLRGDIKITLKQSLNQVSGGFICPVITLGTSVRKNDYNIMIIDNEIIPVLTVIGGHLSTAQYHDGYRLVCNGMYK